MAVAGILDWQSTIAVRAANDASAVAALRGQLAGLQTAAGGAGRASDALALQMQREAAATARAAQQNRALAQLISIQARGEQQRYAIEQKGVAQRLAIEAKGEQDRITLAQRMAAQINAAEQKAESKRATTEQRASEKLLKQQQKADEKRVKEEQKLAHDRLAAQQKGEAEQQASAEKAQAAIASLVEEVSDKIKAAAKWVVTETVDLLQAGEKLGIAETSARETSLIQLEGLLGSQTRAQALYPKIVDLAEETGADRRETLRRVNELLVGGFGEQAALKALRTVGDVSNVVGVSAGRRLETIFLQIQAAGTLQSRSLSSLRTVGLSMPAVYEQIAKAMNVTAAEAERLAKKGKVSADVGIAAIEAVAQARLGGLSVRAGETVTRRLGDVKDEVQRLFDDINFDPLKDTLQSVFEMFKGPEGALLKDSIKELFDTLNEVLFKPLRGPEGRDLLRQFFMAGISTANALTSVLKVLAPLISGIASTTRWLIDHVGLGGEIGRRVARPGLAEASGVVPGAVIPRLPTTAPPEAHALGKGIADGVAAGVREGQPGVLAAIESLISGGLFGGRKKAEVASPSGLFRRELGFYMGAGVASGMDSAAGLIAASSRAMVTGAQRAGTGALGGVGVGMGGAMQVNFGAGSVVVYASTRAGGERAAEGFYARFRALAEGGV